MTSGEEKPRVPASQTLVAKLESAGTLLPNAKTVTLRLGVRTKLRLRRADATEIWTRMGTTDTAHSKSMVVTSATSTQGIAVMGWSQKKRDCTGLTKLAAKKNHQQTTGWTKKTQNWPQVVRVWDCDRWNLCHHLWQLAPLPVQGSLQTSDTNKKQFFLAKIFHRLDSSEAMAVTRQQCVSTLTLDPATGSTTCQRSFQTIPSKNRLKLNQMQSEALQICWGVQKSQRAARGAMRIAP